MYVIRVATYWNYLFVIFIHLSWFSLIKLAKGDIFDHEGLVKAVKQVDVVISAITLQLVSEQTRIIDAIKKAGNIKVY